MRQLNEVAERLRVEIMLNKMGFEKSSDGLYVHPDGRVMEIVESEITGTAVGTFTFETEKEALDWLTKNKYTDLTENTNYRKTWLQIGGKRKASLTFMDDPIFENDKEKWNVFVVTNHEPRKCWVYSLVKSTN